jgi:nucleoside-diphosphate-sugar epimerase
MRKSVPPGKSYLNDAEMRRLSELTRSLLACKPEAPQEHSRYLAARDRSIGVARDHLEDWLRGKKVLVTGGTGCIGSMLMTQLARLRPARLVTLSRGSTRGWPRLPDAEYLRADIRDGSRLTAIFQHVRPDVVFHVAGQRDPGLAELEVHRSVTTNIFGTRNVISAAAHSGVSQVVGASTGKALRPYSSDVYTASKRAAEWLMSQAAASGEGIYSATRFTHVVDNSILYAKLLAWSAGGIVRLHAADIGFYAQSALESAQLMLAAGAGAQPGALWVHAVNDLGWPVNLLDVALGVLARTGSASPIYFSGHERGYEAEPFPALYDPVTAGEVSPLFSAFEAARAERSRCPAADAFPLEMARTSAPARRIEALEEVCQRTGEPGPVRAALDGLSWSLLDATLETVPTQALARAMLLCAPHRSRLNAVHERTLAAIERWAAVGQPAPV